MNDREITKKGGGGGEGMLCHIAPLFQIFPLATALDSHSGGGRRVCLPTYLLERRLRMMKELGASMRLAAVELSRPKMPRWIDQKVPTTGMFLISELTDQSSLCSITRPSKLIVKCVYC
mmetsp:Transcript_6677/g.16294  ORF Transcript_6677/g.16294 Transcript_6677/m.16294 type:complete len:119 (+) Transcript_6677:15-371(+)